MDDKIKENLTETSIDIRVHGSIEAEDKKDFKDSMEDTSLDLSDDIEEALSDSSDISSFENEYTNTDTDKISKKEVLSEDNDEKEHRPASIMDLIDNADTPLPNDSKNNNNLDKRLDEHSFSEVLDIVQSDKKELNDKKAKEKQTQKSKKKLEKLIKKIFIYFSIFIILITAVCSFYIILPTFEPPPETEAFRIRKRKVISAEKVKIDPTLKDEEKLNKFLKMGERFFKKKRYNQAEIIYQKLLKTDWESATILASIGQCRDKLEDESGAVEYYSKAIATEYKGDVSIPLRLADILKKEKKFQELIYALEPIGNRFSKSIKLQRILAEAYWHLKMDAKTLMTYRKIHIQYLDKDQLMIYVKLLMSKGDKDMAFKVYLYLAQQFNYLEGFYEASKIAPTQTLKISVLSELSSKSIGTPRWNYFNMLLAKALFKYGSKQEAFNLLGRVNPGKLSIEDILVYVEIFASFKESPKMLHSFENILSKKHLGDLALQIKIRDILLQSNKYKMALELFKRQVIEFPKSDVSNFMYATLLDDVKNKIEYYYRAIKLNTSFYEANLLLGKLYCSQNRWDEGINLLNKASILRTDANEPQYLIAIAEVRKNKSETPLLKYSKFLNKMNYDESFKLKKLFRVSQYLPTESKAMHYLDLMKKIPSMKEFSEVERVKSKLIYGTLKESDFKGVVSPQIKKYQILYYLGKGEINKVMMLPTLKREFPNFWKVFICWRKNISSWRGNSELLVFKNSDNRVYKIVSDLWQWELSPKDAEKQISNVEYEKRPLVYLMIAERYRKDGNSIKASIYYQTAMRFEPFNLYGNVIKYFKNH